jgi:1-acyl-sn-glycerol-3-phosphate acyltransferase
LENRCCHHNEIRIEPEGDHPVAVDTFAELTDPRDLKTYYYQMTPVRQFVTHACRALFACLTGIRVSGVEHLPSHGPVVLACNHITNYDVIPVQLALPRLIFFMGKEELFRNPVCDWTLRQLGSFPVARGARDEWAFEHALEVLHREEVLGIFPEGTRSKGRGLCQAKSGAARLSMLSGSPVVPLALNGTQGMFKHFPLRTSIDIQVGAPMQPAPDDTAAAFTERIMRSIAGMLPQGGRGAYS